MGASEKGFPINEERDSSEGVISLWRILHAEISTQKFVWLVENLCVEIGMACRKFVWLKLI
jgi:hypothetical protein